MALTLPNVPQDYSTTFRDGFEGFFLDWLMSERFALDLLRLVHITDFSSTFAINFIDGG
jgi:hypothetical protein